LLRSFDGADVDPDPTRPLRPVPSEAALRDAFLVKERRTVSKDHCVPGLMEVTGAVSPDFAVSKES
jgi:hypothetical protein